MPILLQINVAANWGSTGKIAEQIGVMAQEHGWDSYIAYGRYMNPSRNKLIKIGSMFDVYEHYFENRFFDNEGRASRRATAKFLKEVDKINPDVVHLHNIHDHYLNFPMLFQYLAKKNIPVVWTQHDFWAMTGHCTFNLKSCEKWTEHCGNCPMTRTFSLDRSNKGFIEKRNSFTSVPTMTIVSVSEWLATQVKKSFLKNYPVQVIKNGIDTNVFHPTHATCLETYGLSNTTYVIAVASVWSEAKGFTDFIAIRKVLDENIKIVLVGLSDHQMSELPNGIVGIPRTQSQLELAQLYSAAKALVSLSGSETFGLTVAEALSCGTKIIVSNASCLPEIYADTAYYIDPDDTNVNLDELISKKIESPNNILEKYQYKNSAATLHNLLKKLFL
jgi:glycosyltransferase involved in cell wall biosynthesis